jgi:hypothetical protein
MKVYGWDDTGPYRGELLTADVDASDLDFGLDLVAGELGWEAAFTSFSEARRTLIERMRAQGSDPELIRSLNTLKAGHLAA